MPPKEPSVPLLSAFGSPPIPIAPTLGDYSAWGLSPTIHLIE
jgi:hypothetical protein